MLTPEQAREALNRAAVDPGRALEAARALPESVRPAALALLGREPDGSEPTGHAWVRQAELLKGVAARLDAAPAEARGAAFDALFPRLGRDLLNRTWEALKRAPYQYGWARKPFRAPVDPAWSGPSREHALYGLVREVGRYDFDLDGVAAWAGHVDATGLNVAPLLAAALDAGGTAAESVTGVLRDSASNAHAIGVMGGHVPRSFLAARDPAGWDFVVRLLLAAQRQEGLRQSILEAVDESHPDAFRRMLRVILEHDLVRFSATVRALDVWLGFAWDSVSAKVVTSTIERLTVLLDDPAERTRAVASGDAQDAYLGLWATAFDDAPAAVAPAVGLLDDPDAARRFVGVHLLGQLRCPAVTRPHLIRALGDPDLRVAARALEEFRGYGQASGTGPTALFEEAERLLPRVPAKPQFLDPIVWPWQKQPLNRGWVAGLLLESVGDRPVSRLVDHMEDFDPDDRAKVLKKVVDAEPDAPATRTLLLERTADPSVTVRTVALEGLKTGRVGPGEAPRLESLLTRKAEDLRRGVVALLAGQPDDDALASADRLLAASKPEPRRAGLELLRQLAEAGRRVGDCRARAAAFRDARPSLTDDEARQVGQILDTGRTVATLENALGLIDPSERTRPTPPVARDRVWITPAALACARSLSDLVHEHREERVSFPSAAPAAADQEQLLGNLHWGFPMPTRAQPASTHADRLPLREVWEEWWRSRPEGLRDPDGLELVRAWALLSIALGKSDDEAPWCVPPPLAREVRAAYGEPGLQTLPYRPVVSQVLNWLNKLHPPGGIGDFLLDAVETGLARVPADVLAKAVPDTPHYYYGEHTDWREAYVLAAGADYHTWLNLARANRQAGPEGWSPAHAVRLYGLLRWMDEPGTAVTRFRPNLVEVLDAFAAGGATEADLYDQILGPRARRHEHRNDLRRLSGRRPPPEFAEYPALREVVDRCRDRILEVELDRGEAPTAASASALALRSIHGAPMLFRLLDALGSLPFERGFNWRDDQNRSSVFSHLIRVCLPAEGDTPETFAAEAARRKTSEIRLVELAVFAPQWARFVERALGWPQLEEAVWWVHSHTKGADWSVDAEIRELWTAEAAGRTALSGPDLLDGAVDVAWFQRVHKALGPKRWPVVDEAARYASGGTGHARARLFASAMLNQVKKAELASKVKTKRNADALRALGLLPLARGAARQRDVLDRYKVVQEFLRTGKAFGAARQASEKRAAAIALDNLARNAGYADPIRLEWAMEGRAVADLAAGPVTVEADGVTITLTLDDLGQPDLTFARDGKPLKSLPPAVKKRPEVAALVERKTELKRQASRVRVSLEGAMCRGDVFSGDELKGLGGHAVLWPLLSRLVLVGDGIAGYPVEGGRALRDHAGRLEPVKPDESLRVAHPHDLLARGDWHQWQHEAFQAERVQPFKQVFRELYVLTDAERDAGDRSLRYAGQQVNPRQALALLGARGWVNHPEEGVRRTFHDAGYTALLDVMGLTFSPADVEGVTVESVRFVKRGEWRSAPLGEVPPRLFSEVMRDLDLVVSVAHRGGVDPEASASTVEMRGTLLRETCELLGLRNVRVESRHALIEGALGRYSLHLGSGVVHRQPGGALCIVPVHAQHRGRLFLPFADDDPKTAEVLSKALLLARDAEIQDPTILAQIRSAT